ncbi:membrane protein [Salmonella enterica subsp. enterica]|uniref:Membrane protein n=1 Tax=Salmonella enterica I TaxID=59201 RepID=A0A379WMB2_SALET|nr:membrane protein [Salmonella enterica subsp. enterica]
MAGSCSGTAPLSNLLLVPVKHCPVGLCRAFTAEKSSRPGYPEMKSSALREEEFIGGMAIITGHAAVAGTPCEGKFTDKFGQIHYLLLEPEKGKEFKKGDKVLIVCRLSATRYLAERTFYV